MNPQNGSRRIDVPQFQCLHSSCNKSFLRREHLTRHEQGHSVVKPHPCSVCPQAFSRSDVLKRHMTLHSNPGQPKRTLKACENCRRRKVKCDSSSPCGTCISSHLNCERKKAGVQSHRQVALPESDSSTSLNSSDDGMMVDGWSFSAIDLQIDTFGASSGGWCPSKVFRRY